MENKGAEIVAAKETFRLMPDKFSAFAFCQKFKSVYRKTIMEQTIMRRLRDINPEESRIYKYKQKLYQKIA